jgi:uncharacterized membrane protein YcaP (DUF421 family)
MTFISGIDWRAMWAVETPLLEIFLRGTCMYVALFGLLKFILRRQVGTVNTADLLLLVLIADASQKGLAGDYKSITEGILLVVTLMFWNAVIDWAAHKFTAVENIVHPLPKMLIEDGRFIHKTMDKEMITDRELLSAIRGQGIADVKQVKQAYLEGNGHISVIGLEGAAGRRPEKTGRM